MLRDNILRARMIIGCARTNTHRSVGAVQSRWGEVVGKEKQERGKRHSWQQKKTSACPTVNRNWTWIKSNCYQLKESTAKVQRFLRTCALANYLRKAWTVQFMTSPETVAKLENSRRFFDWTLYQQRHHSPHTANIQNLGTQLKTDPIVNHFITE